MRTDSDRNLSAEADPNPARKTRERVLTIYSKQDMKFKVIYRKYRLFDQLDDKDKEDVAWVLKQRIAGLI